MYNYIGNREIPTATGDRRPRTIPEARPRGTADRAHDRPAERNCDSRADKYKRNGVHRRRFSGRKVEKIMSYDYLLTIAIILLSTKVFGLTSERVHMPQVVGALIAGVLVGPSVLNWVGETDFLVKAAGARRYHSDVQCGHGYRSGGAEKTGFASFIIAMIGVIVPLRRHGLLSCVRQQPERSDEHDQGGVHRRRSDRNLGFDHGRDAARDGQAEKAGRHSDTGRGPLSTIFWASSS